MLLVIKIQLDLGIINKINLSTCARNIVSYTFLNLHLEKAQQKRVRFYGDDIDYAQ